MNSDQIALGVSIVALIVATLGPVITGIISLRQAAKEREAERQAETARRLEAQRQERLTRLASVLDTIIENRAMLAKSDELDNSPDQQYYRAKISALLLAMNDKELRELARQVALSHEAYADAINSGIERVADLIEKEAKA